MTLKKFSWLLSSFHTVLRNHTNFCTLPPLLNYSSPQRLDPQQFGHPNHRLRSWRICFDRRKKKWNCAYSLAELAELLLAPKSVKLKLDHMCYFTAPFEELRDSKVFRFNIPRCRVLKKLDVEINRFCNHMF